MTHETNLRSRPGWTWTLVGLLQIGNAAAFGAVAASVDFSASDTPNSVASVAVEEDADVGTTPATVDSPIVSDFPTTDPTSSPPTTTNDDLTAHAEAPRPSHSAGPTSPPTELVDAPASSSVPHVAPDGTHEPATPQPPVLINADENRLIVHFLANGELIELQPGERRTLSGGDAWVVRFHRGGDYGAATEILYDGQHRFIVGPQGWRLQPHDETAPDAATSDDENSSN